MVELFATSTRRGGRLGDAQQAVPRDAAAGERYPDEFMAYIGL